MSVSVREFDDRAYHSPNLWAMAQQRPIPVAQYVRMSTEDQQYSIASQKAAIERYAPKTVFISRALSPTLQEVDWSSVAEQGLEVSSKK